MRRKLSKQQVEGKNISACVVLLIGTILSSVFRLIVECTNKIPEQKDKTDTVTGKSSKITKGSNKLHRSEIKTDDHCNVG